MAVIKGLSINFPLLLGLSPRGFEDNLVELQLYLAIPQPPAKIYFILTK